MKFLPKLIKSAISLGRNILALLRLSAAPLKLNAAIQKNVWKWNNNNNIF